MSRPSIRDATRGDLPALAALEAACFPDPWSERSLHGQLRAEGSLILVAAEDGPLAPGRRPPLVGYASFRGAGEEADLLRVAVLPEARGGGLGRRLLATGLERLRRDGVELCHLEVRPGNHPALALYRALGFSRVGRRAAYYADGSDALVLSVRLAPS